MNLSNFHVVDVDWRLLKVQAVFHSAAMHNYFKWQLFQEDSFQQLDILIKDLGWCCKVNHVHGYLIWDSQLDLQEFMVWYKLQVD